jgi:hypothetical protein
LIDKATIRKVLARCPLLLATAWSISIHSDRRRVVPVPPQMITGRPHRIHPCAMISFSESEMVKTCEPPQKTDNASISKLDSWNWKGREKDLPRLPRGWMYALRTSY